MNCKNCDSAINSSWTFCPACGARIPQKQNGMGNIFSIGLEDVFNRFVNRSFEEIFGNLDENDFAPNHQLKTRNFKGMSVKIVQSGNSPPVINIERFDGPERMQLDTLSRTARPGRQRHEPQWLDSNNQTIAHSKNMRTKHSPEATIEPKIDVVRLPGKIVIEAEVPGVRSIDDIQILELGESLEIRAFAGKKAYMKIVQIPNEIRVKEREFSGEKLRIELGK